MHPVALIEFRQEPLLLRYGQLVPELADGRHRPLDGDLVLDQLDAEGCGSG